MTKENKKLLLECMCEMLPYHLKGLVSLEVWNSAIEDYDYMNVLVELTNVDVDSNVIQVACLEDNRDLRDYCYVYQMETPFSVDDFMPFLVKNDDIGKYIDKWDSSRYDIKRVHKLLHWCYKRHIDVSGLIELGIAKEAPQGTY